VAVSRRFVCLSLLSVRQERLGLGPGFAEKVGVLSAEDFSPFHALFLELKVVSTQGDKSDYSSVVHVS